MPLTQEQEQIAQSQARTLVVNAYAGSGKTSVLEEYARRRPNVRMLYLAFNRSIKEEAAKRFPSNVRCVTTHGLAFPAFGSRYQRKLGNPKASHVARLLNIDMIGAGMVLATLTNFMASADYALNETHAIPVAPMATPAVIGQILNRAERVWDAILDPDNFDMPTPHDAYLKAFQISRPVIRSDRILFDEAQDANPVTVEFVLRQDCAKTIVGDRHQSIYGFRGAVNALESIAADETLNLTASFRFGAGIAELATGMLMDWCGATKPVRGLGRHATNFKVDRRDRHAFISRTNGRLFAEAVHLVQTNRRFGFAGGVEGYRFDAILDAYNLYSEQRSRIRDQFIASFEDFHSMREYAEQLDDKEIKVLVNVVEEYRHDIPRLIQEIKDRAIANLKDADVTLATAHKSKGLEFLNVILGDDFTELVERPDPVTGKLVPPKEEEVNVLYVALTRAMAGIEVPANVRDWLANSGRYDLLAKLNSGPAQAKASHPTAPVGELITSVENSVEALLKEAQGNPQVAPLLADFLRQAAAKIEGTAA